MTPEYRKQWRAWVRALDRRVALAAAKEIAARENVSGADHVRFYELIEEVDAHDEKNFKATAGAAPDSLTKGHGHEQTD